MSCPGTNGYKGHVKSEVQTSTHLSFWFTLNYIFVSEMGTLDFLELRYRVEWPVNIVITEKSVVKYNKVSLSW